MGIAFRGYRYRGTPGYLLKPLRGRRAGTQRSGPAIVDLRSDLYTGLWCGTSAYKRWVAKLSDRSRSEQVEEIEKKLHQLNEGFTQKLELQDHGQDGCGITIQSLGLYDLSPLRALGELANFQNLTRLTLGYSPKAEKELGRIVDLRPIQGLLSLKDLDLSYSSVNDLMPLDAMRNIEFLRLQGCTKLTSLEPLRSLKIKILNLNETYSGFDDLEALKQMTSLEKLSISATMVSSLQKLSQLRLTALTVANTPLQNLEGINPSRLEALQCQMSKKMQNLSVLRDARKLVILNCGESLVYDLAPLANLPSLRDLNLTRTKVQDLSPLESLPNLHELILQGSTGITDLSCLLKIRPMANLVVPFRKDYAGPLKTQIEELMRHHKQAVHYSPF